MPSHSRHGRRCPVRILQEPDFSPMWLFSREPDYGFRRPGSLQGLFSQLMGGMQPPLDEMERARAVLMDVYPHLALTEEGQARKARHSGPSPAQKAPSQGTADHLLSLDVSGFSPEELTVQLDGRKLTVSGKHDQKAQSEDGCFSHEYREVRREVLLPEDADLGAVACALGQDGRLCVEAPRLALPPPGERTISIAIGKASEATGQGTQLQEGQETKPSGEQMDLRGEK
ncbi:heat shock protein 30C-like [Elgaria multicarinata webbii]|uniref:heat shock protein 30C-like n=1 Tax=Elgaria multicarinata webbii TaxID=159646 RepID=UPI002FCD1147